MSAGGGQVKVKDAVKELTFAWLRAKEHWNDDASAQFHAEFIEPLESACKAAIAAMNRISEVSAVVRRECE